MGFGDWIVSKREMAPGPTRMELSTILSKQVHSRTLWCIFSSGAAGHQCATVLETLPSENPFTIKVVRLVMPLESNLGDTSSHWANFTAVLYPSDLLKAAMAFWRDTSSGLSIRHAEFCLEEFDYLDSDSSTPVYRTPASRKRCRGKTPESLIWMRAAARNSHEVKSFLADLATSEQPGQPTVSPDEVFTRIQGCYVRMLYPETVDVVRRGTWAECLSYKYGTEEELDRLEALLQSGQQIRALFCELPSNITLASPNLCRIRALADIYGFVVACDDTVAGYVNIDALPYVDVMMSSLTKTFSGASNVTGGCLVINPDSRHHDQIHTTLSKNQDAYFPLDVNTLRQNSKDIVWRVKQCNPNTLPLIELFQAHPAIAAVNDPSIAPTSALYKSVMRKDGGYGNVLSIVFHDPRTAEHCYNVFNVCKGSSFGANFTLAIPYVQLANYWNQDKVAKHGVPRHIIRISVGLEDSRQIVETAKRALKSVDEFEMKKDLN
ncbi:hypothetical protein AFLA_009359 [Aspergillus flavus NRRL3357]|nr:hypothetical protein AFLA_009359 [Aspergillus flavus NRRL3357]